MQQASSRIRLFIVVILLLIAWYAIFFRVAIGATFHGTIRQEGKLLLVRWTNVPGQFFVQSSTDLTNWQNIALWSSDATTNDYFEYQVTNQLATQYMRLRTLTALEAATVRQLMTP